MEKVPPSGLKGLMMVEAVGKVKRPGEHRARMSVSARAGKKVPASKA